MSASAGMLRAREAIAAGEIVAVKGGHVLTGPQWAALGWFCWFLQRKIDVGRPSGARPGGPP